jgi:hypothetical protein
MCQREKESSGYQGYNIWPLETLKNILDTPHAIKIDIHSPQNIVIAWPSLTAFTVHTTVSRLVWCSFRLTCHTTGLKQELIQSETKQMPIFSGQSVLIFLQFCPETD